MSTNNKNLTYGAKIKESLSNLAGSKAKATKSADSAQAKYQKDLEKYQKDMEKWNKANATADQKMKDNFQNYKNKLIKSFSGSYSSNLAKPGNKLPTPVLPPTTGNKVASCITDRGYDHIINMIRAREQNVKLARAIKYLEFK